MTKNFTINKLSLFPTPAAPIQAMLQYKYYLDPGFTLINSNVTINADGTLVTPQSIGINTNSIYIIRATNLLCGSYFDEMISFPCTPTCPAGWLLSSDGTYCYTNITTPATPPSGGNSAIAIAKSFQSYSTCGSFIFNLGFNPNGTGTYTQIPSSNSFWVNGPNFCVDNNTTSGPLNRTGIWISTIQDGQTVGFSQCLNISATTTYYIGCGADNSVIINLDGNNIITQDPVAMYAAFPFAGPNAAPFKMWCIYPVVIQAGNHVLEVIGYNTGSGPGDGAAIGIEIYQNTSAQIMAATDYTGLNLIFSTKNVVGQPINIGSGGFGYTCPTGYSLQTCSSPFVCVKQLTTTPNC